MPGREDGRRALTPGIWTELWKRKGKMIAHELSDLRRARIADLVRVFEDNSAFECNLSDVEGKGEKPGLCRKGVSGRENKLDEISGMDTKLMLPCRTPTKTCPRDGITTEVNHSHVRSHLTSDPDMERGRTGRRVSSARRPLEMPLERRRRKRGRRIIVLAGRR